MTVKSLTRSSLVNNRWYENMLVGNAAYVPISDTYELLETQILTGTQTSVTFSNLNSTYGSVYQHLQIRMTHRAGGGTRSDNVYLQFNSSGSGYAYHYMYGEGSTTGSGPAANQPNMIVGRLTGSQSGANIFGASVVEILDPFETTKNKTVRSFAGATDGTNNTVWVFSGLWNNTAAVTSFTLTSGAQDFIAGSRFSLYGTRAS
jgi:hypothetical protein